LFLWKYLSDKREMERQLALIGFNPCFYGSIFLTIEEIIVDSEEWCFNPCFYGSIFLTQLISNAKLDSHSFNPCFYGSIFLTSLF